MQTSERVVAVTGAASGMGKEVCKAYARRGAKIGLLDRDREQLDVLASELRQVGACVSAVAVDVTEREQVQAAVRKITSELGPIDIAVACAGICRASTVDDLKILELEDVVRINFLGTVYTIEAVLPAMLTRKSGNVAAIASLAGVRGIPFESAYSASKAAVTAYLESLRCELRPRGINVTTIFPGYVQTPLLDGINGLMGADMSEGKAFTAEAAAQRIIQAIDRKRAYLYFPFMLALGVRLSRLLTPRVYDFVMEKTFSRFPISQSASTALPPAQILTSSDGS